MQPKGSLMCFYERHVNPINIFTSYSFAIYFTIYCQLRLGLADGFPFRLSEQNFMHLLYVPCVLQLLRRETYSGAVWIPLFRKEAAR
jgi:hypothetical protein